MAFRDGPVYDAALKGSEVGVDQEIRDGVYGILPDGLGETGPAAVQVSPLIPGAARLEESGALTSLAMLAPPGTTERRYAMALGLRALEPGAPLSVMAPKSKGGARLGDELRHFGCSVEESAKRHHRICRVSRPAAPEALDEAVEAGKPRRLEALGLWSQPGVFSWDRIDPGSALLLDHLPPLFGKGADLGCGIGILGRAALASPKVKQLVFLDIDRRAIEASRRNVEDPRASFRWADLQSPGVTFSGLDFIIMNPPFHQGGGGEDPGLGQTFIRRAAEFLRPGGTLWLTANRHLPYEAVLRPIFKEVTPRADRAGFKIVEARR